MILMSIVYVILALLAGTGYVEHELSNGENAIIFSLIQAGTFTAGFVVVLQGADGFRRNCASFPRNC